MFLMTNKNYLHTFVKLRVKYHRLIDKISKREKTLMMCNIKQLARKRSLTKARSRFRAAVLLQAVYPIAQIRPKPRADNDSICKTITNAFTRRSEDRCIIYRHKTLLTIAKRGGVSVGTKSANVKGGVCLGGGVHTYAMPHSVVHYSTSRSRLHHGNKFVISD